MAINGVEVGKQYRLDVRQHMLWLSKQRLTYAHFEETDVFTVKSLTRLINGIDVAFVTRTRDASAYRLPTRFLIPVEELAE